VLLEKAQTLRSQVIILSSGGRGEASADGSGVRVVTPRDLVPGSGGRVANRGGRPIMLKALAVGTRDLGDSRRTKVVVVG